MTWSIHTWSIRATTQILAGKWIFVKGGKLEKTLGVRLRSTNHSSRTSPGSNAGRSGGRRGWCPVCQPDSPLVCERSLHPTLFVSFFTCQHKQRFCRKSYRQHQPSASEFSVLGFLQSSYSQCICRDWCIRFLPADEEETTQLNSDISINL